MSLVIGELCTETFSADPDCFRAKVFRWGALSDAEPFAVCGLHPTRRPLSLSWKIRVSPNIKPHAPFDSLGCGTPLTAQILMASVGLWIIDHPLPADTCCSPSTICHGARHKSQLFPIGWKILEVVLNQFLYQTS